MAEIKKKTERYPTDLTEEEWTRIRPLLPGLAKSGRPVGTDLRAGLNVIRVSQHKNFTPELKSHNALITRNNMEHLRGQYQRQCWFNRSDTFARKIFYFLSILQNIENNCGILKFWLRSWDQTI